MGLVHLGYQFDRLLIKRSSRIQFGLETCTRVVPICVHGKCGERQQIDAVAFFQCLKVG